MSKKIYFYFGLLFFIILFYFHTRGIYYSDDGYILNSALRVAHGQIPYRNFHFAYTPLSMYVDSLSFLFFGTSILASRIVALVVSLITCFVLFKISKHISKTSIVQLFPLFLFLAWGPSHSNFIFPTTLAIFTGLITILFLFEKKYFWSGFFTVITILSKQNFGIGLILVDICYLIFSKEKNKISSFTSILKGIIISTGLYILYLLTTNSFIPFIQDFKTYTLDRIVTGGTLSTSFFYGFSTVELGKTFFYLLPFLLSLYSIYLLWKKRKELIFLPLFVLIYYILGIRPTTDYIHLTPLLSLIGIPLVLILENITYRTFNFFLVPFIFLLVGVGFYTALFKNYYRWNPPLWQNTVFLDSPREQIFAFDKVPQGLVEYIQSHTKTNEPIFVNYYAPMIYFVSARVNPTKFDLVEPSAFYKPYRGEIISSLEKN